MHTKISRLFFSIIFWQSDRLCIAWLICLKNLPEIVPLTLNILNGSSKLSNFTSAIFFLHIIGLFTNIRIYFVPFSLLDRGEKL